MKITDKDIQDIQRNLQEGYQYTRQAKNQNLVLLVGRTGAGKSLTGNYLLGHEIVEVKDDDGAPSLDISPAVRETRGKDQETSFFDVGQTEESCTLFSKPILLQLKGTEKVAITDCAGFEGNRKPKDTVVESISMELAIRSAYQVKANLITVPYDDFRDSKIAELFKLVKILGSLFKNPIEMLPSSVFMVTKKDMDAPVDEVRAKQRVSAGINKVIKRCDRKMEELQEGSTDHLVIDEDKLSLDDYRKIKAYMEAALKQINEIIFVNPCDGGTSRQLVLDKIQGIAPRKVMLQTVAAAAGPVVGFASRAGEKCIQPITIEDFNFSAFSEARLVFNEAMCDLAFEGSQLIETIADCARGIIDSHTAIRDCEQRSDSLAQCKASLETSGLPAAEIDFSKSVALWGSLIKKAESEIKQNEKKVGDIDKQLTRLETELRKIDTNVPIVYKQGSINETAWWFSVLSWYEFDFDASAPTGIEFVDIQRKEENGTWVRTDDRRQQGEYHTRYESSYRPRPAVASVKVYIKTKDDPSNRLLIKKMNSERSKLKNAKEELLKENQDLIKVNQEHQINIEQAKTGQLNEEQSRLKKIKECEDEIARYQRIKQKDEATILQRHQLGQKSLTQFNEMRARLEFLVEVAQLDLFENQILVVEFIKQYAKFMQEKNSYEALISQEDASGDVFSDATGNDSDKEYGLDPINQMPIKDPVVILGGTGDIFDRQSLLALFEKRDKSAPYHFQFADGREVIIRYLQWECIKELKPKKQTRGSALFQAATPTDVNTSERQSQLEEEIRQLELQVVSKKSELAKLQRATTRQDSVVTEASTEQSAEGNSSGDETARIYQSS